MYPLITQISLALMILIEHCISWHNMIEIQCFRDGIVQSWSRINYAKIGKQDPHTPMPNGRRSDKHFHAFRPTNNEELLMKSCMDFCWKTQCLLVFRWLQSPWTRMYVMREEWCIEMRMYKSCQGGEWHRLQQPNTSKKPIDHLSKPLQELSRNCIAQT